MKIRLRQKYAKNKPANLETHFDGVLLSQTSNVPIKMSEDCSNKYHLHDKISVIRNQVNNNNIKKYNLNKTYHMNNLTDYINQNKNLTEINSALPDKIDSHPNLATIIYIVCFKTTNP